MWHRQRAFQGIAAVVIAAATLATSYVALQLHIGVAAAVPGFMLLAMLASWRVSFNAAALVSLASTACLDYFFTEPKFSLAVNSYQDVLALSSFVVVSLLISHMVQRIRTYSRSLEEKEKEQSRLLQLSQNILLADTGAAPEEQLCVAIRDQLHLRGIALWDEKTSKYWFAGDAADAEESLQASLRAQANFDLPSRGECIRILRFGARSTGAVLFRGNLPEPMFLNAVAAMMASNIERVRAMRAEMMAESQALSEQLRTAVLDGLAHSVKTPLTTIGLAASGLLEIGHLDPLQRQLAQTIGEQASNLSELTNKLLRTAKLDHHDVRLRRQCMQLRTICEEAIMELPRASREDRIQLHIHGCGPQVTGDPEVLRMALTQVLENGLKYSPADSIVTVRTECEQDDVEITIHNDGSFIPPEERHLIFERYYRSPSTGHKAPGTGLGLSIAKRAIEVHDGSLRVESSIEEEPHSF